MKSKISYGKKNPTWRKTFLQTRSKIKLNRTFDGRIWTIANQFYFCAIGDSSFSWINWKALQTYAKSFAKSFYSYENVHQICQY